MKTMKKVLILCLIMVISITTLAACGDADGGDQQDIEFTVTYCLNTDDPNAKFVPNEYVQQVNKYYNAQMIDEPAKPVWVGHDFLGWFYDKECTKDVKFNWDAPFSKDTTLYAKWVEQNSFVFKFYCKDHLTGKIYKIDMFDDQKNNLDTKVYHIGDVLDSSIVNKGYEEFKKNNKDDLLKGRDLSKSFATAIDNIDSNLEVKLSIDTKIESDFDKYAVAPQGDSKNYEINLYVQIFEKEKKIEFLNGGNLLYYAKCEINDVVDTDGNVIRKQGAPIFDKLYKKDANGNEITVGKFEQKEINGELVNVMPSFEGLLEDHQIFNRWQVTKINPESMEYYNEYGQLVNNKGQLINNENKLIDEVGGEPVYFMDNVVDENVQSIYCNTHSKKYSVTYQITMPFDENGNISYDEFGNEIFHTVYLGNNGDYILAKDFDKELEDTHFDSEEDKKAFIASRIRVDNYIYNSSMMLPDNDVRPLLKHQYNIKWAYTDKYKKMGVEKGELVEVKRHQIKQDIKIITVVERKIEEVAFVKNENEFFNTNDKSTTTTMTFPIDVINDILLNPQPDTGLDFKTQVGNMYYVFPNTHTPTDGTVFTETIQNLINEREKSLLMQHYKLKGFCLAEDKNLGDDAITQDKLLIIVTDTEDEATGKITRSFSLRNGEKLKVKDGTKTLVLKPIFKKQSSVEVKIDLTDLPKDSVVNDDLKEHLNLKSTLGTTNGTRITSFNTAIKAPGYKFSKWVVTSSPFDKELVEKDNLGEIIANHSVKEHFNGVEFNDNYPVLGTTTIKPVFVRDEYTLVFKDTFGNNLLTKEEQIKADIDTKKVTNTQIENAISKLDKSKFNKPEAEKKFYEFDGWYANIDNERVSLEDYLVKRGVSIEAQKGNYSFNMDRDVTFEARYKYIEYEIVFNEFDTYETKDTVTYKPATLENKIFFNKDGVLKGQYDALIQYMDGYKPLDFNYVNKNGIQKNYVIGWYYKTTDVNGKETVVNFSSTTSVTVDTAPVKDGKLDVFPLLQEYKVTLNAGLGYYTNFDQSGKVDPLNPKKQKVSDITGGFFGFEIPEKEIVNKPQGYDFNKESMFYFEVWNSKTSTYIQQSVIDNHIAEKGTPKDKPLRVTDDTEYVYQWTPIDYTVTVKFINIDGTELVDRQKDLLGNVEKIYYKKVNENTGVQEDVIYTLDDLVKDALYLFTPVESYYTYVYEMKDGKESEILNHQYVNPGNNFTRAERNRVIYVQIKYNNLHLTLNANGGHFVGPNIKGDVILESYIDKDSALTINQNGKLSHGEDAFSAYVTKNQENLNEKKNDQQAPVREGYVFIGFATVKNAKIGVDKFYYGYKNALDIRDYGSIFNNTELTCWLGDTTLVETTKGLNTKFMDFASGLKNDGNIDLIEVEEGSTPNSILSINTRTLYAQWLPVKVKVNYLRPDGTKINVNDDILNSFGGQIDKVIVGEVDSQGNPKKDVWSDLLNPGEAIKNPYNYAKDIDDYYTAKDKSRKTVLINFVTENKGIYIENKNKEGRFVQNAIANQFADLSNITLSDTIEKYYTAECNVIESIKTGIQFAYDVVYEDIFHDGNTPYLKQDAFLKNHFDGNDITVRPNSAGDYFAYRDSYRIVETDGTLGRFIDTIKGNPLQAIQFVNNRMGRLEFVETSKTNGKFNAGYYYVYTLKFNKAAQEIPLAVNVEYNEGVNTKVKLNGFNDSMINPYYNAATMQTEEEENGQLVVKPNYYKSVKVRPFLENGEIHFERLVWKTKNTKDGIAMEPEPYTDLTKNKKVGISANLLGTINDILNKPDENGIKHRVFGKYKNQDSLIVDASMYGVWEKDTTLTKKVQLKVNYYYNKVLKEEVDENGHITVVEKWSKYGDKDYFQDLNLEKDKYIMNPSYDAVKNEHKYKNGDIISEDSNGTTVNILYQTWKVDKKKSIETLIEAGVVKYHFDIIKHFNHGVLLENINQKGKYYVTIEAYESWEIFKTGPKIEEPKPEPEPEGNKDPKPETTP